MNRSDGSTAAYYELPEDCTELQHLISHRDMNAQIGEIFRACYRYGIASHSDKLRDAKKMRFYAQAEIERLEKLLLAEEPAAAIDDDSERQQRIQQSGEMAEEVYAAIDGAPDWRNAPELAVAFFAWEKDPAFYADGGDRFFRLLGDEKTPFYVMKGDQHEFGLPVFYRPQKD